MHFQFLPKLMTLDDLERPKCTLAENCIFYTSDQKNLNKDKPYPNQPSPPFISRRECVARLQAVVNFSGGRCKIYNQVFVLMTPHHSTLISGCSCQSAEKFRSMILDFRNNSVLLTNRVGVHGEWHNGRVTVPIYNARSLRLSVQPDCLTRSSNTRST